MKELKIQNLLRNGMSFDELKAEYGIKSKVSEDGKLVNLKYSQIDSDKTLQVVHECRGIILEMETWNIVSRGFERFFNYGEENTSAMDFDFNSADLKVLEKADGSVIQVFNYQGEWRISTSGVIDGVSNVNNGIMNFRQLFEKGAKRYDNFWENLNVENTYVFELISPINQIVTPYERTDLVLLSVRTSADSQEKHWSEVEKESERLGVRTANVFELTSLEDIKNTVESLPDKEEGFVIVDFSKTNEFGNYARVKMKSAEYVKLQYLKDAACKSVRVMVGIVLDNEDAEFTISFPELKEVFEKIRVVYEEVKVTIQKDWDTVKHLYKAEMDKDEKREFAKAVMQTKSSNKLFTMQKLGLSTVNEYIEATLENELARNSFVRYLIEYGDLKNMEVED